MKKYEFLEHTADIKCRVYGLHIEDLFENVVLAFSEYVSRRGKIEDKITKKIIIKGEDNEQILYKFMDELIYLMDAEDFIVCKGEINFHNGELKAILHGDNAEHYDELEHVKAATYSEMYIRKNTKGKKVSKGWQAQFVLDV